MNIAVLDTVGLERDLPEHGLRKGDIGAVVERYEPDGAEVEFVTASGKTQALVTLKLSDLRPVDSVDRRRSTPPGFPRRWNRHLSSGDDRRPTSAGLLPRG